MQNIFKVANHTDIIQLFIEVSNNKFVVYSKDENDFLNGLEMYTLSYSQNYETQFQEIYQQSNLLFNTLNEVFVTFQNPYALCIPKDFYNELHTEKYRDMLIAPSDAIDYISDFHSFYVFYFADAVIVNTLKKRFSSQKITHKFSVIINRLKKLQSEKENKLYVAFDEKKMIIAAFKKSNLLFINSFDFNSEDDALFHLLHINKELDFTDTDTMIFLSGLIDKDSSLYQKLYAYFTNIQFDIFEKTFQPSVDAKDYAPQMFTPYLSNTEYFNK